MCDNSNCIWELISWWKTMIKGDLVEHYRYQCKSCGEIKID
jgi:hypothetical protein